MIVYFIFVLQTFMSLMASFDEISKKKHFRKNPKCLRFINIMKNLALDYCIIPLVFRLWPKSLVPLPWLDLTCPQLAAWHWLHRLDLQNLRN